LLAPDTGLTVLAGLSYLRVSPVHGTAFDIAGRGLASHANLTAALLQAARWARPGSRGSSRADFPGPK
jgi:4-hydroxythreonine-4-phosphate dehydrogenase